MPAIILAYNKFEYKYSRKWSAIITPFNICIFISRKYNFNLPGGVKNAIDYLYNE